MHDSKLFWEETTEPSTEEKCSCYDYYMDGHTGTVHLWGEHTETDILLKIAEDLDIEYAPIRKNGSKFWEDTEIKRGKWIPKETGACSRIEVWYCSECEYPYRDLSPSNYCPYCGAKMDIQ